MPGEPPNPFCSAMPNAEVERVSSAPLRCGDVSVADAAALRGLFLLDAPTVSSSSSSSADEYDDDEYDGEYDDGDDEYDALTRSDLALRGSQADGRRSGEMGKQQKGGRKKFSDGPEEEDPRDEAGGGKSGRGLGNQSDTVGMLPPNSDSEEEEEMPKSKGNKGQSAFNAWTVPNVLDTYWRACIARATLW